DDWSDSPVRLPPGRARLATKPPPSGSAAAKTIGTIAVGNNDRGSRCDNDINPEPDQLGSERSCTLVAALGPPILDRDIGTVDPAQLSQPLQERGCPFGL